MEKKELEWCLNELYQSVISASLNFDIWWCFREKKNWDKYSPLFKRYPRYFRTSRQSHFRSIIIILYRLFENNRKTINFPHFFKAISGEELLKDSSIQQIHTLIEEAKPTWKKIAKIRSGASAHVSNKCDTDEIFQKAKINPNQIKALIQESKIIYNLIASHLGFAEKSFNWSATRTTNQLLDQLMFQRNKL